MELPEDQDLFREEPPIDVMPTITRGNILPYQVDDYRLVNKAAHRGIYPDSPTRRQRAVAGDSDLNYAVEIQDADGHWHLASQASKLISRDREIVSPATIRSMTEEVAQITGYDWRPSGEFFDGHSFNCTYLSPKFKEEVAPGDSVQVGLMGVTDFMGATRPRVEVFVNRLVCTNGMIVKDMLFSLEHEARLADGVSQFDWMREIEKRTYEIRNLDTNFQKFVGVFQKSRDVPVGKTELVVLLNELGSNFPSSVWGDISRRFWLHEEETLFGLINACSFVTWHRNEKATVTDFARNERLTTLLLGFAERANGHGMVPATV